MPAAPRPVNTGIARSTRDRVKMAVSDDPFARQAITTFRVLERFEARRGDEGYTLVECHLYTGRARLHLARPRRAGVRHARSRARRGEGGARPRRDALRPQRRDARAAPRDLRVHGRPRPRLRAG